MKKIFIAAFMLVSSFGTNVMADGHAIKMGIILGFTGPIESLTPAMRDSAKLAFEEASASGSLLGGKKISVLEADSTCVDSAAATAAAEGLISQGTDSTDNARKDFGASITLKSVTLIFVLKLSNSLLLYVFINKSSPPRIVSSTLRPNKVRPAFWLLITS